MAAEIRCVRSSDGYGEWKGVARDRRLVYIICCCGNKIVTNLTPKLVVEIKD